MSRLLRTAGGIVLVLLVVVLVGPFLIPVRPLEGLVPPEQLADADSSFAEVNGVRLHYKLQGEGQPAMVLLHGFAASTFTWREVMAPLAERGTIVAFDRPASGLTERPMPGDWEGESPYSLDSQAGQTVGLMDQLGIEQAVLVGNSAGGTLAVLTALCYPERVQALVLVSPAIYRGGGAPAWIRPLLRTPQAERLGPLVSRIFQTFGDRLIESAWHDSGRVTAEVRAGYGKPLQAENWDRALWELTKASGRLDLDGLEDLRLPVLVVTGDDDRIVPAELSVRLAGELPNAELAVVPDCGHVAHEECPQAFLSAVSAFLDELSGE